MNIKKNIIADNMIKERWKMFKEIRLKFQSDKTQLILKINFTEIMDWGQIFY